MADCHSTPESGALRLGLDHTDDGLVDVQQVVNPTLARLHHDLADSDAGSAKRFRSFCSG